MFADFFVESGSLFYNGFEIAKSKKLIKEDSMKDAFLEQCAVLKKKGRVLITFDGITQGGLAAIDFGLAPLLSPDSKQLVVSQTRPRGGRHWVVDLSHPPRVLFDSFDWEVGREDVWITDLDKDGIGEIILELPAFYMFEDLSPSVTPLPEIVFRYDLATKRYVPANPTFDYGLDHIEEAIERANAVQPPQFHDGGEYLGRRLEVVLRYLFVGRKVEGWSFFDRSYARSDKKRVKASIEGRLVKEPVYRFLYRHNRQH